MITTVTARPARGTDCQHGVSCNGGPVTSTWLRGDWQTREAVLAQQNVHRP